MVWEALTTIAVPAKATTDWFAGIVWGTFRARISMPISNGSVTVLAVRPEEQKRWSRRYNGGAGDLRLFCCYGWKRVM